MDGNVSLSTVGLLLGALGFVALTAAFLWYYRQSGGQKAQAQALEDYKSLAESRKAKNEELESEKAQLAVQLKEAERERDGWKRESNECAQQNLRLLARMEKLEKAFNALERRFHLPETNFDDPTHRTDEREH